MTLRDRLISYLNDKNISQGKFERLASLSNGFVNNIGDGISTTSLIKILRAFPDLSASWLLTGTGDMILGDIAAESDVSDVREEYVRETAEVPQRLDTSVLLAKCVDVLASQQRTIEKHADTIHNQNTLLAEQHGTIASLVDPGKKNGAA